MAAASRNCRLVFEYTLGQPNQQFFESPGYPLLPIKKRLSAIETLLMAFVQGDFFRHPLLSLLRAHQSYNLSILD